jgi:hypothetical protein
MISTLHMSVDGVVSFKSYYRLVFIIKEFGDFSYMWPFVSKGDLNFAVCVIFCKICMRIFFSWCDR